MANIEKLLEMLESSKASDRYEACELLRVSSTVNETALAALEKAVDDPDPGVREAAQRALDLHKSALQSSQEIPLTQQQMNFLQEKLRLENRFKGGVSWFYWIAGASIINSIIVLFNYDWIFILGLGLTQIIDWFAYGMALELDSNVGTVVRIIALVISLAIACIFILCGVLARKRRRWAFILGMVLYALDSLIMLALQVWLGFGFHMLALFGLFSGWKALQQLEKLESPQPFPTAI
jgi:hypothetical protein